MLFLIGCAFFCSGVLSTILLYMVDVKKSRQECEAFVAAEASRAAFSDSQLDVLPTDIKSVDV